MARTVSLPARELQVTDDVDVLVAGGGPAGVCAAIAAARDGASVLLIERLGALGGLGTSGLVPCWAPISDGRRVVLKGLAWQFIRDTTAAMPPQRRRPEDWVGIDAEVLKRLCDDRVEQAGARVLLHTQLAGVLARDGRVGEAVVCNKAGLSAARAKVFIDCTGDGDLAAWAGAEFQKGDPADGRMQPATLCFLLAGVDADRFFAWRGERPNRQNMRDAIARGKADGELHIAEGTAHISHHSATTIGVNFSHVFAVDGTDPRSVSDAEREARRLVAHLVAFMRKRFVGCEHAVLAATGAVLGIRETRRIVGDYVLTVEDYFARRSFPDEIARNSYLLDVHPETVAGQRRLAESADELDYFKAYGPGESHGIPFRCLLPKNLANVLVAGRCLSADRPVQGAVRCIPHCMAMGEAAGCAAAMATAAHAADIREVDVEALREKLREHGAYLP